MKISIHITILSLLASLLVSCGQQAQQEEQPEATQAPKTPVSVVGVQHGSIYHPITLLGTTFYLKRNTITAPIPAFIKEVNVHLGDQVQKGDVLYVLQTKESRALGGELTLPDSSMADFGIIKVKAAATGMVTTLDKQQSGDYVLEGVQLCTIAESNDLVVQVNVPFEYIPLADNGKSCRIVLPDRSVHTAKFTRALSSMNMTAQTQTVLAKFNEQLFLPENMIVTAELRTGGNGTAQLLARSCVLSDEMMQEFWVMRMMNDSVAVKIPVKIGQRTKDEVEVLSPTFAPDDRIISVGNYGLPDTALVDIQHNTAE
ncbi:MAG: HlyD family efflux transporter periplasmic adaptor subunit [Flavobacteriales bacterium]|nr:HlyD family efflux transporter periplasmic adaptor subunit [Flavobacteriales bacterium]